MLSKALTSDPTSNFGSRGRLPFFLRHDEVIVTRSFSSGGTDSAAIWRFSPLVQALWSGKQVGSSANCELTISVTGPKIAILTFFRRNRLSPQPASRNRS
jgi:hypothetical protein